MADVLLLTEVRKLKGTTDDPNLEYVVISLSVLDESGGQITVNVNRTLGEVEVLQPGQADPSRIYLNDGRVGDGTSKRWAAN